MSVIDKLDRKKVELVLKIYTFETDFNFVLSLLSINSVAFFYSLKYYPDLFDDFNEIVKFISLNNEEKIYANILKVGEFNATTTNMMIKSRNKNRYTEKSKEEIAESISEIDEKLNRMLGKG